MRGAPSLHRCTPNACSKLYSVVSKTARGLGYDRIVTYTLPDEGGASLRAAGWICEEMLAGGGTWSRKDRPREDNHPTKKKLRWRAPTQGGRAAADAV
jgi:hypothetical protein